MLATFRTRGEPISVHLCQDFSHKFSFAPVYSSISVVLKYYNDTLLFKFSTRFTRYNGTDTITYRQCLSLVELIISDEYQG